MPGVFDYAESGGSSRLALLTSVAFPQTATGRHSDRCFRSSIPCLPVPLSTLQLADVAALQARLEVKMESLLLSCGALSSPTMCRFIPALAVPFFHGVHARRSAISLPGPACLRRRQWRSPGSRAYCFLACLGSSTTPSLTATRDLSLLASVAFPQTAKGRHPDRCFRSSIPCPPIPLSTLRPVNLTAPKARLGARMESLLLSCRALSSPTICRFIPALAVPLFPERFGGSSRRLQHRCMAQGYSLGECFR
jgi:hypothetical protein